MGKTAGMLLTPTERDRLLIFTAAELARARRAFGRSAGFGRHLDIAAGAAVRFDPGVPTEVALVPIAGARVVVGFSGLVDGPLDAPGALERALERARALGFDA